MNGWRQSTHNRFGVERVRLRCACRASAICQLCSREALAAVLAGGDRRRGAAGNRGRPAECRDGWASRHLLHCLGTKYCLSSSFQIPAIACSATTGRAVLNGGVRPEGLVADRTNVVGHGVEVQALVGKVGLVCLERFEPLCCRRTLLVALALPVEGVPEEVLDRFVDVAPHELPVAVGLVLVVAVLVLEGEVALLDQLHHVTVSAGADVGELPGHDDLNSIVATAKSSSSMVRRSSA